MTELNATSRTETPTPKLRVRLVSITVQVEAVADDGTTLHPIETQPVRIPISAWSSWHPDLALAELQSRLTP
jgi:hypothetical protein